MKTKLLITLAALTFCCKAFTQDIPNAGFEEWSVPRGFNMELPTNWGSRLDTLFFQSPELIPTRDSLPGNVHSGKYSCKLQSNSIGQRQTLEAGFSTYFPNWCTPIDSFSFLPTPGIAFGKRPAYFSFYYKYLPVDGDLAGVLLITSKTNKVTGEREGISLTLLNLGASEEMKQVLIPLHDNYFSPNTPDSASISFSSSNGHGRGSSTLWIDDVQFFGDETVGVEEVAKNNSSVSLYPNPCTTSCTISTANTGDGDVTASIFDLSGKELIRQTFASGEQMDIDTRQLTPAVYMVEVPSNGQRIDTTKLMVR